MKRIITAHELLSQGGSPPERVPRARNYFEVAERVAASVKKTAGKISAKRLLAAARMLASSPSPWSPSTQ